MQSVKLITHKNINKLRWLFLTFGVFVITGFSSLFGQDNSPYSRYGIGDLVPSTNVISRGMGGVTAAYADIFAINLNNPASFSSFQTLQELKSKKLSSGRAILDVGMNFEGRTLKDPATTNKFVASNALFSYVQVGVPLRPNWGLSFGLRPISRISYNIYRSERLVDPNTGLPIDSAITTFKGDGGSYLVSLGTGFSIIHRIRQYGEEKLSVGINGGYFFGKKDYSTRRSLINDSVEYNSANFQTKTNFGNLWFNAGIQYKVPLSKLHVLNLGAYGNIGQKINGTQDILRETFVFDPSQGEVRLDSVYDQKNIKGVMDLPSLFSFGFMIQKLAIPNKEGGWLFGMDYLTEKWSDYRFFGQTDQVRNRWEVRLGAALYPIPKRNYFSRVAYRFGLFTGPDYINVGSKKLNQTGGSFGLGLPFTSRTAPNQTTLINLAVEYIKRGNNDNVLKENLFRVSLGLSLSDFWFIKRKYD
jgi:hypothetical protein